MRIGSSRLAHRESEVEQNARIVFGMCIWSYDGRGVVGGNLINVIGTLKHDEQDAQKGFFRCGRRRSFHGMMSGALRAFSRKNLTVMTLVVARVSGYVVLKTSIASTFESKWYTYVYLPLLHFVAAEMPDHTKWPTVFTVDTASMIFMPGISRNHSCICWLPSRALPLLAGAGWMNEDKKSVTA
jgi:hypothetical protein